MMFFLKVDEVAEIVVIFIPYTAPVVPVCVLLLDICLIVFDVKFNDGAPAPT